MAQNTSYAVMAQRKEPLDSLDDFPTPPWATRALMEFILTPDGEFRDQTCLEPACGAGHMSKTLSEYFRSVQSYDIADYGFGQQRDFLKFPYAVESCDWIITNPPFKLAEEFVLKGLSIARTGVAILARTVFLESIGRYERLFKNNPPTIFAQFVERVPMVKGRLDANASTATGYCWLVWQRAHRDNTIVRWIPPCRRDLEHSTDYPINKDLAV